LKKGEAARLPLFSKFFQRILSRKLFLDVLVVMLAVLSFVDGAVMPVMAVVRRSPA